MKRQKFITADGSPTFYIEEWNEYYHSKHGAVEEAMFVYINRGLKHWLETNENKKECYMFELGFGMGLNALLAQNFAEKHKLKIIYSTLEAFPLNIEELNSATQDTYSKDKVFEKIHTAKWEGSSQISDYFIIEKKEGKLENFVSDKKCDVVFYDAFGSRVQPELWTKEAIWKTVKLMNENGVWVTYSAKGSVRRDLKSFGMEVERLPGPPNKREMIRGIRK